MDKCLFEKICAEYKQNYVKIFKQIYPAKNSTGFTERNLSVNFSKAYETIIAKSNQNSITWYEFQFGNANNEHYDAVIINTTVKEILVIEAKRFNLLSRKINSAINDIKRINNFVSEISNEHSCRIPDFNQYKIYGVILSDIWTGNTASAKQKSLIKEQYADNTFIEKSKYINIKDKSDLCKLKITYNIQNFDDCAKPINSANFINCKTICNNYHLLSMTWEC